MRSPFRALLVGSLLAAAFLAGAGPPTADRVAAVTLEPGRTLPERPMYLPPRWGEMRVGLDVLVDDRPLRTR